LRTPVFDRREPGFSGFGGKRTSARRCHRYLGWAVLIGYALILAYRAWYHEGNRATSIPLWQLQDSHRLAEWLGGLVLTPVTALAYFVPIGLLAALVVPRSTKRFARLRTGVSILAISCIPAVLVRVTHVGGHWEAVFAPGLIPPLLGCLLGIWIGVTWRRGWRARLWFLPKVALLVSLGVLCVGIVSWLLTERTPLPFEAAVVTAGEKRRLAQLARGKDPTSLEEGQTHTLQLTQHDLNVLLSWLLSPGSSPRKATVDLACEGASLSVSIGLPLGRQSLRYLNLILAGSIWIEDGLLYLAPARCRLGPVELPGRLLNSLGSAAASALHQDRRSRPFLDATRTLVIQAHALEITYGPLHLPPGAREELFGLGAVDQAVLAATQAQIDQLLVVANVSPRTVPGFGTCFETVFTFARNRSLTRDPVTENQAAIFALGILLGRPRLAEFIGPIQIDKEQEPARRALQRVTLRGRADWAKHFCVSAAIATLSDVTLSNAAGRLKEELDADTGGSGFSFSDLLADRAGATFAVWATRDEVSARAMQDRLALGFHVEDFFPPAADLPEGIPEADFQTHYGGKAGEPYRRLLQEIERRVAACPAYGRSP